MSNDPTGKDYLGIAYNKSTATESNDPADYTWSLYKGSDGVDGVDGTSTYTWIKYADDDSGGGMSDDPDGKEYMGIAYNKTTITEGTNPADYSWSLIKGSDGADGLSTYTWIKYADDVNGSNMSNDPAGKDYLGIAYNKNTATESIDPADYTWSLYKGSDGVDGVDGTSTYTWIKYADDDSGTGMSDDPDGKEYMGIAYNKTTITEGTNPADYSWSLIKGSDGADGLSTYTWIKYADDVNGSNMSNDPTGKDYLGIAYNKNTATESTDPADYTWSLYKGSDGVDGVDGTSTYTWIKYADDDSGTGMSDDPDGKEYMGIAYNKTTITEGTNPADYSWSLIKGSDGVDGLSTYTWIKYADDDSGTGLSNDPAGKDYLGIAYNKNTATESTDPADYTWSLYKGSDGVDGVDGTSTYTWIKYADDDSGGGMSDDPDGKEYMGIAYNKNTVTESTNPADYSWSLIKGSDGLPANSLYITYINYPPENKPAVPTGDGTSDGWHTNMTDEVVWQSQKIASGASAGTWGDPFIIFPAREGDASLITAPKHYHVLTASAAPSSNSSQWNTGGIKVTVNGTVVRDVIGLPDIYWLGGSYTEMYHAFARVLESFWNYEGGRVWYNEDSDGTAKYQFVCPYVDGGAGIDVGHPADAYFRYQTDAYIKTASSAVKTNEWLRIRTAWHTNAFTSPPSRPTGDGSSGGWSTSSSTGAKWRSTMLGSDYGDGSQWSVPVPVDAPVDGHQVWKKIRYQTKSDENAPSSSLGLTDGEVRFVINGEVCHITDVDVSSGTGADQAQKIEDKIVAEGFDITVNYINSKYVFEGDVLIDNVWKYIVGEDGSFWDGGTDLSPGFLKISNFGIKSILHIYRFTIWHTNSWDSPPTAPTGDGSSQGWVTTKPSSPHWQCTKESISLTDGDWNEIEAI
jgi:hypothetical protein